MSRLSSWDAELKLPAVQIDKEQEGRIKEEEEGLQHNVTEKRDNRILAKNLTFMSSQLI